MIKSYTLSLIFVGLPIAVSWAAYFQSEPFFLHNSLLPIFQVGVDVRTLTLMQDFAKKKKERARIKCETCPTCAFSLLMYCTLQAVAVESLKHHI